MIIFNPLSASQAFTFAGANGVGRKQIATANRQSQSGDGLKGIQNPGDHRNCAHNVKAWQMIFFLPIEFYLYSSYRRNHHSTSTSEVDTCSVVRSGSS